MSTERSLRLAKDVATLQDKHPELKHMIYATLGGSLAYGTDTPTSDIDLVGVTLPHQDLHTTLYDPFTKFELKSEEAVNPIDHQYYDIKFYMNLALKANPSVLEHLFTNDKTDLIYCNDQGRLLRENKQLFVTKRIIHSFGSYAGDQLRRYENATLGQEADEELATKHLHSKLELLKDHFKSQYGVDPDSVEFTLALTDTQQVPDILMDINLTKFPLQRLSSFSKDLEAIKKGNISLGKRNTKPTEAKLNKHLMHLVRLYLTATEAITEGTFTTRRPDSELELLMSIRNGVVKGKELTQVIEEVRLKFDEVAKATKLPDQPNYAQVDRLYRRLVSETYNS